jgi:hypothetical protein
MDGLRRVGQGAGLALGIPGDGQGWPGVGFAGVGMDGAKASERRGLITARPGLALDRNGGGRGVARASFSGWGGA